jgi:hypothetical protein
MAWARRGDLSDPARTPQLLSESAGPKAMRIERHVLRNAEGFPEVGPEAPA